MKKTYIIPTSTEIKLNINNVILTTSGLKVGETMNSGSGDARENDDEW